VHVDGNSSQELIGSTDIRLHGGDARIDCLGLATLLGFWSQPGHAFLKVVLIQTMTPSVVISLAVVQALGLKSNLANACWLTTNLVAISLAGLLTWLAALL